MNAILQAADRAATSRNASLVLHLFDLGHALLVEQMAALGVAAPPRFMDGDSSKDVGPAGESDDQVDDLDLARGRGGYSPDLHGARMDEAYDRWEHGEIERARPEGTKP